jgi:hypothetical protein
MWAGENDNLLEACPHHAKQGGWVEPEMPRPFNPHRQPDLPLQAQPLLAQIYAHVQERPSPPRMYPCILPHPTDVVKFANTITPRRKCIRVLQDAVSFGIGYIFHLHSLSDIKKVSIFYMYVVWRREVLVFHHPFQKDINLAMSQNAQIKAIPEVV